MSTALEIQRTPDMIAVEINSIKSQTRTMILCNSIEIGRRLVEAKTMIEHGQWGTWLTESVDYSQRTASNLMRIFEEYGANQIALFGENTKSQALANLSYTQAVALLGVPEEEREQFIEEHDVNNMSTRELQQAIKDRDEALRKLKIAQDVAKEKNELALKYADDKHQIEANLRVTDKAYRDAQADIKMLQETLEKEREKSKEQVKKLEKSLTETKSHLSNAKATGNTEEVKRLEELLVQTDAELDTAQNTIKELEQKLKEKPIDVPAAVEVIPEAVEKELEELRKNQRSAAAAKYKVYFDELVNGFNSLLGLLNEMADEEEREKYKKATTALIGKMKERL